MSGKYDSRWTQQLLYLKLNFLSRIWLNVDQNIPLETFWRILFPIFRRVEEIWRLFVLQVHVSGTIKGLCLLCAGKLLKRRCIFLGSWFVLTITTKVFLPTRLAVPGAGHPVHWALIWSHQDPGLLPRGPLIQGHHRNQLSGHFRGIKGLPEEVAPNNGRMPSTIAKKCCGEPCKNNLDENLDLIWPKNYCS